LERVEVFKDIGRFVDTKLSISKQSYEKVKKHTSTVYWAH